MGTVSNACTGTTIAKVGASGILLTAGHCVVQTSMGQIVTPLTVADPSALYVLPGPDWQTNLGQSLYFGVVEVKTHPSYDGNVNSPFDVALVRYVGATAATQVIPAITPEEDKLAVGSTVTIVGFGKTETNVMNSQRREVDRTIATLQAQQFLYDQHDSKGACEGDSGGPALLNTPNGPRVAGVTSFGDPACVMLGASVRVSPLSSFIQSYLATVPTTLGCGECTLASVGPGNPCVAQSAACGDLTTACGKFLDCAGACTTQTCVSRCSSNNPQGSAAYTNMVKCQCGNACTTVCASNPNCQAVGGGTTNPPPTMPTMPTKPTAPGPVCGGVTDARPDCASCIQSSCCGEASACAADTTCAACLKSPTSACSSNAAFSTLTKCESTCPACTGPAPQPVADAGTGQPGVTGGSSGCGCNAGGAASRATSLGLLAALAILFARRRRPLA
jgi:MYXO-CTERM domain-containing protein